MARQRESVFAEIERTGRLQIDGRAERAFVAAGFSVLPAPLGFVTADPDSDGEDWIANDFFPDIKSFWQAHYVLYELIGAVWYRYF